MKEPKLFAEIRKARERAEKAAKAEPPAPIGPIMTATVVTPDPIAAPNNYIANALNDCTTVEQCNELLTHSKQHGFADDGQTVQLIRAKIESLRSGAKPAAKKTKRSSRSPDKGTRR